MSQLSNECTLWLCQLKKRLNLLGVHVSLLDSVQRPLMVVANRLSSIFGMGFMYLITKAHER